MVYHGCVVCRMASNVRAIGSVLPQLRNSSTVVLATSLRKIKKAESFLGGLSSLQQRRALRLLSSPLVREIDNRRVTIFRCEKHSRNTGTNSGDVEKPLLLTTEFWLQAAIFLFAAGFIDAGFSGDWSRIGVLTKETEGELQMAAIGVVPLAGTLIWSIAQRRKLK
ncbi:hypothetical protein R1sor_006945 [Riccia sorocarpa]|uniref:DUF7887 domain-containing protein n=1 Tax=Riccia sorocarpa TaxID=122646 RepID=A0ABD3HRU8_9MARC